MQDREAIRKKIKIQRKKMSVHEQKAAAYSMTEKLINSPIFAKSQNYSAYMAIGGEIDPLFFIAQAANLGKKCYLPVINPEKRLMFYLYKPGDACIKNHYGIAEPKARHHFCVPSALDFVLVPLLAFDVHGNRLGMGAGYYDRTFDFLLKKTHPRKPLLIGLGYQFQRVDIIVPQKWDVPLDAVVTEETFYQFNPNFSPEGSLR